VKKPNPLVNYKFTNPIVVGDDTVTLNNVNFHIPTLIKEVKELPKSKIRQYKKIIKTFLVTASSFLILPLRSMAETSIPVGQMGTTTLPQSATGMPPELLELLLTLLKISVGAAVILSAICLVFAGVLRMFRKKKEANEWTVDIIKSIIQILVAVPVVFLIYYVANLLFGHSGWFVSPF
jgi:uncharacterized membrane protein YozB (DUF420 family)